MIHNHISHSASHPGLTQLVWEFIQVSSKYVWVQTSHLPYPEPYQPHSIPPNGGASCHRGPKFSPVTA